MWLVVSVVNITVRQESAPPTDREVKMLPSVVLSLVFLV